MQKYIIGSDEKTAAIAKEANDKINEFLKVGDFEAADKAIDEALSSPNRPFVDEFLNQVETCAY